MSYIQKINQPNPFWDWISSMEGDNTNNRRHPWFEDNGEGPSRRGRSHGGGQREAPPPPPDNEDGPPPPEYDDEKTPPPEDFDEMTPPGSPPLEPQHSHGAPHLHGPPPGSGPHGRHRHRSRGRRGRGGPHHGRVFRHGGPQEHGFPGVPPFFGGGGPRGRRGPGGFGWWGRRGEGCPTGGWGAPHGWKMDGLSQIFKDNFDIDVTNGGAAAAADKDFNPPVDVFDTPEAFVVHVSLAGAKKEDLGVSWDPEKSELNVAGVIHRPGDEEFLKTLAMDERDIGAFERKIKLGSKAHPVTVDADGISAKMEDGVLMVRVPKVEEFVEIKKVDIQ